MPEDRRSRSSAETRAELARQRTREARARAAELRIASAQADSSTTNPNPNSNSNSNISKPHGWTPHMAENGSGHAVRGVPISSAPSSRVPSSNALAQTQSSSSSSTNNKAWTAGSTTNSSRMSKRSNTYGGRQGPNSNNSNNNGGGTMRRKLSEKQLHNQEVKRLAGDGFENAKGTRFGRIEILTRGPGAILETRKEAIDLLRRAAITVRKVMDRHNWDVPVLREFLPSSPVLLGLNVNQGREIRIRLSYPGNPTSLLPFNEILGTLLHELVHNVRGPHDDVFYNKLAELTNEVEMDINNGWKGEGFDAPGERLGSSSIPPRLVSESERAIHESPEAIRRRALEAAEKRRKAHNLMSEPSGGHRLGSGGIKTRGTPAEMARLAAELRAKDMARVASRPQLPKNKKRGEGGSDTNNVHIKQQSSDEEEEEEVIFLEDLEREAQGDILNDTAYESVHDNDEDSEEEEEDHDEDKYEEEDTHHHHHHQRNGIINGDDKTIDLQPSLVSLRTAWGSTGSLDQGGSHCNDNRNDNSNSMNVDEDEEEENRALKIENVINLNSGDDSDNHQPSKNKSNIGSNGNFIVID